MKIIMLICVLLTSIFSVSATDVSPSDLSPELGHGFKSGVHYTPCSEAELKEITNYVYLVSDGDAPAENAFIISFDVSESGRLAIVTTERRLVVYNADGSYSHSASFDFNGEYGVLWAGENVALMSKTTDSAYVFSDRCELLEVYRMDSRKASKYWKNTVMATERRVGDTVYSLSDKRSGLGSCGSFIIINGIAYKKLTAQTADGEQLIYQSSEGYSGGGELSDSAVRFLAIAAPVALLYVLGMLIRKFAPSANPKA